MRRTSALNCFGFELAHFGQIEMFAELEMDPGASGADAEILGQEFCPFVEIDLLDRLPNLGQQHLADLPTLQPLQVAIADIQLPAGVDQSGQRFPVPLARFFVLGKVFLDRVDHLPFGHAGGFVARHPLGRGQIDSLEIAGFELDAEQSAGPLGERGAAVVFVEEFVDVPVDLLVDHFHDQLFAIAAVENPLAVAINPFALLVAHLVVFEQVLATFEVLFFDLLLSPFDPAADHPAFDRFALLHAEPREHVLHPFAGEDPHQIVFQRQVESAGTGVSLPTAAAAQLQVDPAGFVPLGADDVQAAERADFLPFGLHLLAFFDLPNQVDPFLLRHVETRGVFVLQLGPGHRLGVSAQDDVGAAAGHVGGDGDGIFATGLGDDFGLAFVMLGVEHLVLDAAAFEHRRETFALLDRHGSDQDRAPPFLDVADPVAGDVLGRRLVWSPWGGSRWPRRLRA